MSTFVGEVTGAGTVWGPCPVCDAWQVELPENLLPGFEGLRAVEEAIREHWTAEHQEALRAVTAKPTPTWKRPDTRHVRRIVQRALAERLGPGLPVPPFTVERWPGRGVAVSCNSAGNVLTAAQALRGRGYIVEWSSGMADVDVLVLDPLPGRPRAG